MHCKPEDEKFCFVVSAFLIQLPRRKTSNLYAARQSYKHTVSLQRSNFDSQDPVARRRTLKYLCLVAHAVTSQRVSTEGTAWMAMNASTPVQKVTATNVLIAAKFSVLLDW